MKVKVLILMQTRQGSLLQAPIQENLREYRKRARVVGCWCCYQVNVLTVVVGGTTDVENFDLESGPLPE